MLVYPRIKIVDNEKPIKKTVVQHEDTWSFPRSVKVMLLDTQLIAFFSRHQTILEHIWEGIKFSSSSMAETILLPSVQLKMSQLLSMQSFGLWASQKWLLQYCYFFAYRFSQFRHSNLLMASRQEKGVSWDSSCITLDHITTLLPHVSICSCKCHELPSCQSSNDNSLRIFLTMFAKSSDSSWNYTNRTVWLYR